MAMNSIPFIIAEGDAVARRKAYAATLRFISQDTHKRGQNNTNHIPLGQHAQRRNPSCFFDGFLYTFLFVRE
ncbi:hypothetical protein [Bifidobacterium eulemuris]|uniref:Uncharacterized protein n=1 Tax=Bifidobacterium eulemuris TaxID=1765219 RepID=A0A7L9SS06_9BIFI|nr:hypothetical protein [Bifidobacterium eulemuris]QOL32616.1 hypothetical protein BE0216_09345 [Bifidobacterium eulemuris]